MNWREAFQAMSIDADRRSKNAADRPKNGPNDPHSIGRAEGAAYAFNVMAEELKFLSSEHTSSREALSKLRRLLGKPYL